MKKILLILFIIAGALTAQAQEFRFGLTTSPVLHWYSVDGNSSESDGTKLGFQYGLLFDQTIGSIERYAFSTGLLINMGGGRIITESAIDTFGNITSHTYTTRVQYIEIPLTFRLRTDEVNYITYYGQFGLTPGVAIKAEGDVEVAPDPGLQSENEVNLLKDNDFFVKYNLFNVSLTIGGGVEYAITENTAIMAGLFFQNGFSNVLNNDNDEDKITLKQLGLRLAVLF